MVRLPSALRLPKLSFTYRLNDQHFVSAVLIPVHSYAYCNVIVNSRVWKCCCNLRLCSARSERYAFRASVNVLLSSFPSCIYLATCTSDSLALWAANNWWVDKYAACSSDFSPYLPLLNLETSKITCRYVPADCAKNYPVAEARGILHILNIRGKAFRRITCSKKMNKTVYHALTCP
jgi:hypothetical protein